MKPPKLSSNAIMMAWYKLPGFVYFFKAGSAIKIGVAAITSGKTLQDAVRRRMKQVQSANHEPVELLGLITFDQGETPTLFAETLERELHIKFDASSRFKQHTIGAEWFNSSEALLSYITDNARKPEALGLPRTLATPRVRS
jgi:hypothetical protein